jgi:tRNA modification GTPase
MGELLASLPLDRDVASREIAINARHAELLSRAGAVLITAIETLEAFRPPDLVSVLLNDAIAALGEITGETVAPDVLARIFGDFCIGK